MHLLTADGEHFMGVFGQEARASFAVEALEPFSVLGLVRILVIANGPNLILPHRNARIHLIISLIHIKIRPIDAPRQDAIRIHTLQKRIETEPFSGGVTDVDCILDLANATRAIQALPYGQLPCSCRTSGAIP